MNKEVIDEKVVNNMLMRIILLERKNQKDNRLSDKQMQDEIIKIIDEEIKANEVD